MKKLFLVFLILIACTPHGEATKELNKRTFNEEGETILTGQVTVQGLRAVPFDEWYSFFYEDYALDSGTLDMMREDLQEIDILVFLGTWCGDSQWQVPGLIKMLEYVGYDMERLTLVALERDENRVMFSPDGEEEGLDIGYVPTYIFYREGKELGRIIENPMQSLEKDVQKVLGLGLN